MYQLEKAFTQGSSFRNTSHKISFFFIQGFCWQWLLCLGRKLRLIKVLYNKLKGKKGQYESIQEKISVIDRDKGSIYLTSKRLIYFFVNIFYQMAFQKKSVSPKLNESFLQLEPTDSHLWRDEGLNLTNERKQDSEDSPENWQAYLINFYEEENNPQQHEKVSEKREMKEFQIMPERKFFPEGKVTNRLKHYFSIFQERFSLYQQQFVPDQLQSLKKTISRLRCKLKQQGGINRKDLGSLLKKKKAREIMSKILIQDHCQNSVSQNKLTYLMASKLFSLRCKSLQLIERNSLP